MEVIENPDETKQLLSLVYTPQVCKKKSNDTTANNFSSAATVHTRSDNGNFYNGFKSKNRNGPLRKIRRRAVFKNGDCNILQSRISRRSLRFLQDLFTTLVDTQWRWLLLVFGLSFVLSWLVFAIFWWLILYSHGDLEIENLPKEQEMQNWKPCVTNINSFASCFLFSIETQQTIGYGVRSITEECPESYFMISFQCIVGIMIQALMVGIVFAKMSRPKHRTQTLLFSRNAVICQRDGQLCLMFRVGDMRKSHIIGASIRAQLIKEKITNEKEILQQYQHELCVGVDGCDNNLFFIWPMTITHKIDEKSPLFNLSASDLLKESFEIVVILEGTIESTGQTTQARSSYLACEILWGHRFRPVVNYNKEREGYEVDYSCFDNTFEVETPLCSGKDLQDYYTHCIALVNRKDPILLHENARPHIANMMLQKFNELGYEILLYPAYSSDLSPTGYRFFKHLDQVLNEKSFGNVEAQKSAFQDFMASRTPYFYSREINKLIERWQKCIYSNGSYFDLKFFFDFELSAIKLKNKKTQNLSKQLNTSH